MVISWFGLASFKISSGSLTVVTDPFSKEVGLTPPRLQTDIAIISNNQNKLYNNKESLGGENTFVIDGPGEFDTKGLFVQGIAASGDPEKKSNGFDHTTIYSIRMDDIRIGFLGGIKQRELSQVQLERLGEIDILIIPVGGQAVCNAEEAVAIVNQVEPRIIIPMHFSQPGLKIKTDKLELFLKEIGAKAEPQERLTIKKSELLEEGAPKTVILEPQR